MYSMLLMLLVMGSPNNMPAMCTYQSDWECPQYPGFNGCNQIGESCEIHSFSSNCEEISPGIQECFDMCNTGCRQEFAIS